MRCIFCKAPSGQSRSREHIVPESLGNTKHVLPPGVVCDSCNHYFAVKVEKTVLDSGYFTRTRFMNAIPNKKGRIPKIEVTGPNGEGFEMYRTSSGLQGIIPHDVASEKSFMNHLFSHRRTQIWSNEVRLPDMKLVSRLLAKMALEILVHRWMHIPGWETQVIDRAEFDDLRAYARFGLGAMWPFYERRIYPERLRRFRPDGSSYETMHEFDLLYTEDMQLLAVICLLGMEFTMNYVNRDTSRYFAWLVGHGFSSPLYPQSDPASPRQEAFAPPSLESRERHR